MFCDGLQDTIASAVFTVKMFSNTFNIPFMPQDSTFPAEAAIDFLKSAVGIEPEIREIQDTDVVPEDFVKSGDVVLAQTFGGANALIMYATGSLVGHTGIAMWIGEQLYVLESQSSLEWPKEGIQANTFKTFSEWNGEYDTGLIVLPLRDDVRAKFNETAALDFFKSVQGLPYGFHNFIFSGIDTPISAWPPLLPAEFMPIFMALLDGIAP